MNWRIVKIITGLLLAALLIEVVADILDFALIEYGSKGAEFSGCYAYDAMLFGFQCQGFPGSAFFTIWLNWPLWMVYAPRFAVLSPWAFVAAIIVWSPLIIYIVSSCKVHRLNNA